LVARRGADSDTGSSSGAPYTVQDEENTTERTPAASMAVTSETVPVTLTV
jgi:hypothetical protein